MLTEQSTILFNDALAEDLKNQITSNSLTLRLKQKHSSNKIQEIHQQYNAEEEYIRNEMKEIDDTTSNEYMDLMAELKDLQEEEDQAVEQIENESADYETGVQMENDDLETRLEAVKSDTESFEEALKQNIEKTFGYFK